MALAKGMVSVAAWLALCASQANSEGQLCAGTQAVVIAQDQDHAALVCEAATRAKTLFADCAVPALTGQVTIRVVGEMPAGCLGLFYCDTQLIEVLSPDVMQDARSPQSIFSDVATNAYFQSIVVHELAHAATYGMPCPFDGCSVGPEYIAYLMQMKSLDPAARAQLTASIDIAAPVSFDGFHPLILMMAPDAFSQRVWAHHHQQDDPCGFVDALIRGDIFLDVDIFGPELPD